MIPSTALIKDGWSVTDEQVKFRIEDRSLFIDLEAAKITTGLVVLIEVKELDDVPSAVEALANALGKYELYRFVLEDYGLETPLYLAVTDAAFDAGILGKPLGQLVIDRAKLLLLIFNVEREEIVRWLP